MLIRTTLAVCAACGDPSPRFAGLEAATWTERDLAQRRLAAELVPGDGPAIRVAFVQGGAETRLRLAHVFGSEDRLFGTAAELAVDPDPEVARAALTGLRLAIERFEPYAYGEPIPADELMTALVVHDGVELDAQVYGAWEPTAIADLIALAEPSAPRLVFLGDGATSSSARAPLRSGTWREFARSIAQRAGGKLVGFGLRREPGPSVVRWLAVTGSRADLEPPRASDVVEQQCLEFARADAGAGRARAARALASHGMPVALEWLARRVRDARDDAALEGLLLAARRGAAPAVLQEPAVRAHLWSELERTADEDGDRALHAALALARVGLPVGSERDGELARALTNLDLARPRRAAFALVALEGWAEPRGPTEIASAVRGLLARPELAPAMRMQALRIASRLGIVEPSAGDVLAFASAVSRGGRWDELRHLLRGAPGWPPDAWADTADLPLAPGSSLDLVEAWLARGSLDAAAKVLARELSRAPAASSRVRGFAVPADRIRDCVERAARSISGEDPATWFVLCGVATEVERRARLAACLETAPSTEAQWLLLGTLCSGSTGEAARTRLVALLPTASPEIAFRAASRAVETLRGDLADSAEQEFLQAVRGAVRAERGSPLDRAFGPKVWPPAVEPPSVRLIEFDRDPERGPR